MFLIDGVLTMVIIIILFKICIYLCLSYIVMIVSADGIYTWCFLQQFNCGYCELINF